MRSKDVEHCERTGRMIGHCGCGDCYARRLAKLVRDDPTLQTASAALISQPRYLVSSSL